MKFCVQTFIFKFFQKKLLSPSSLLGILLLGFFSYRIFSYRKFFFFSQSSVCLIFFLEFFALPQILIPIFYPKFIRNIFGQKIDSNFYFISFFDINLFIICIM